MDSAIVSQINGLFNDLKSSGVTNYTENNAGNQTGRVICPVNPVRDGRSWLKALSFVLRVGLFYFFSPACCVTGEVYHI